MTLEVLSFWIPIRVEGRLGGVAEVLRDGQKSKANSLCDTYKIEWLAEVINYLAATVEFKMVDHRY